MEITVQKWILNRMHKTGWLLPEERSGMYFETMVIHTRQHRVLIQQITKWIFAFVHYFLILSLSFFLDTFANLRKAFVSFVTSLCPSFRPHATIRLPLDGFSWNLSSNNIFFEIMHENISSLKSDENKGYFTWRPINIYGYISHNSSYNEKSFI